MGRTHGIALLTVIAAALAVLPAVALLASGTPAGSPGTSAGSADASAATGPGRPSAEVTRSPSGQPSIAVPDDAGAIFWAYAPPPTSGAFARSYPLQAGTLAGDRPLIDIEVPWNADLVTDLVRHPAVGDPTGGAVVYVADDGTRSEVHRAAISRDGPDEVVAILDDVVWDLVVAPDGRTAYAAIAERGDTQADRGVVRVALDGSGAVDPVLPRATLGRSSHLIRVAFVGFNVELAMSADGRHLLRRACSGSHGCTVEVVDLSTGGVRGLAEAVTVYGMAGGALAVRRCDGAGCHLAVDDLESGASLDLDADGVAALVAQDGRPVLVTIDAGALDAILTFDVRSGRHAVLYRPGPEVHLALGGRGDVTMSVPAGWVHVTESRHIGDRGAVVEVELRELLISLGDGRVVEIPPAPIRPIVEPDTQG